MHTMHLRQLGLLTETQRQEGEPLPAVQPPQPPLLSLPLCSSFCN